MTARTRWAAQIKKNTAQAPPLTDKQRNTLAAIFGTTPPPSQQDRDRADAA